MIYSALGDLTCAVVKSLSVNIRPRTQQNLSYLSGANIAGPEEGSPGTGVSYLKIYNSIIIFMMNQEKIFHLQTGPALHQQADTVGPSLPGSVVQGRATLAVLVERNCLSE